MIYTTIIWSVCDKFDLSLGEYCLADVIYHFANNPNNNTRWCFASRAMLAKQVRMKDRWVFDAINSLVKKGIVEVNPDTKHVRTTQLWYDAILSTKNEDGTYAKNAEPMQKMHNAKNAEGMQNLHRGYAKNAEQGYAKSAEVPMQKMHTDSNNIYIQDSIEKTIEKDYPFSVEKGDLLENSIEETKIISLPAAMEEKEKSSAKKKKKEVVEDSLATTCTYIYQSAYPEYKFVFGRDTKFLKDVIEQIRHKTDLIAKTYEARGNTEHAAEIRSDNHVSNLFEQFITGETWYRKNNQTTPLHFKKHFEPIWQSLVDSLKKSKEKTQTLPSQSSEQDKAMKNILNAMRL